MLLLDLFTTGRPLRSYVVLSDELSLPTISSMFNGHFNVNKPVTP